MENGVVGVNLKEIPSNIKQFKRESCKEYVCQYTTMTKIGREFNGIDKAKQFSLRVFPALRRRIKRYLNKLFPEGRKKIGAGMSESKIKIAKRSEPNLKAGDWVKVLPYKHISLTLNEKGYCKGLRFQEDMEKYCGKDYEILKIPDYLMEEGGKKISKCKDVIILNGVTCNGVGAVLEEGCDRCCLYYWKKDWVEKIN